ncbi:hypothetical protein C8Q76DRAFT_713767 [Earliella scabrosa]|nr:hypothetical protein C8Q76DRAFT_713767 [Earliella scabrosa]
MLGVEHQLMKTLSLLRSGLNMHRPLSSLPVEILTQVISEIPAPSHTDAAWSPTLFWYPAFQDSSLLVPLSQTCRRLRHVALSRPDWWRHVTSSNDGAIPTLLSRNDDQPLEVVIKDYSGTTNRLRAFYASITPRMRGLHFLCTDYPRLKTFRSFLQLVHPELESFTCCGLRPNDPIWHERRLVITQNEFPRLRHLVLQGIAFRVTRPLPTLTHLILSQITLPRLHIRVARLLCSCPSLENVVLSQLFQPDDPDATPPQPLLPHLRRVVLHDLVSRSLRFYLSLTALCGDEVGLQILNVTANHGTFAFEPVVSERVQEDPVMLGIGTCTVPAGFGEHTLVSLTVASPVSAVRIASTPELIGMSHYRTPGTWVERVLPARERLAGVQEVWIVNASPRDSGSVHTTEFDGHLREVVGKLPALQTVVLSTMAGGEYVLRPPRLSFLPSIIDDPSFNSPDLKTLRLVQCSSSSTGLSQADDVPDDQVPRRMDFSGMLTELASSAYCYLERLVVQIVPGIVVEESDVEQLREYFSTVVVERILEPPRMPLPQCCVEVDEGPGGSCTWTRSPC